MPQANETPKPVLRTETQASKYLGFSVRTLQKWRTTGNGPQFVRASARAIRYHQADLDRWIEERRRSSTSEVGRTHR